MPRLIRIAGVVVLVGCGTSGPTAANVPPANFSGTWSGLISTMSGNGTLELTLTQQPLVLLPPGIGDQEQLGGTWSTSFPNPVNDDSGTVSGTGWSASVSVAFALSGPGRCALNLTGTRTGTPSMSGTYTTSGCAVADAGTFAVSKTRPTASTRE